MSVFEIVTSWLLPIARASGALLRNHAFSFSDCLIESRLHADPRDTLVTTRALEEAALYEAAPVRVVGRVPVD